MPRAALPTILLAALFAAGCGSAPHDLVSRVPDGSELSRLDRYLIRGSGSTGEVIEWIPAQNVSTTSYGVVRNEFGLFRKNPLGDYDLWKATAEERNRFTGEITFTHMGSTSADVNGLVYIKGKLRKKDWGFLPG